MIDFPFLFLASIRLHSYTAFIRERHSARMLHREGARAARRTPRKERGARAGVCGRGQPAGFEARGAGRGAQGRPGRVCNRQGHPRCARSGGERTLGLRADPAAPFPRDTHVQTRASARPCTHTYIQVWSAREGSEGLGPWVRSTEGSAGGRVERIPGCSGRGAIPGGLGPCWSPRRFR